jgi:hypothetical protein
MVPDLIKITELFLIPSSFLVAALGTADTNFHKAAVSVLGLSVSLLWLWCSREAQVEAAAASPPTAGNKTRVLTLTWFPLVFIVGWAISVIAHLLLIRQPLGSTSWFSISGVMA